MQCDRPPPPPRCTAVSPPGPNPVSLRGPFSAGARTALPRSTPAHGPSHSEALGAVTGPALRRGGRGPCPPFWPQCGGMSPPRERLPPAQHARPAGVLAPPPARRPRPPRMPARRLQARRPCPRSRLPRDTASHFGPAAPRPRRACRRSERPRGPSPSGSAAAPRRPENAAHPPPLPMPACGVDREPPPRAPILRRAPCQAGRRRTPGRRQCRPAWYGLRVLGGARSLRPRPEKAAPGRRACRVPSAPRPPARRRGWNAACGAGQAPAAGAVRDRRGAPGRRACGLRYSMAAAQWILLKVGPAGVSSGQADAGGRRRCARFGRRRKARCRRAPLRGDAAAAAGGGGAGRGRGRGEGPPPPLTPCGGRGVHSGLGERPHGAGMQTAGHRRAAIGQGAERPHGAGTGRRWWEWGGRGMLALQRRPACRGRPPARAQRRSLANACSRGRRRGRYAPYGRVSTRPTCQDGPHRCACHACWVRGAEGADH